ncbi:DUF1007 family protein [Aquibium sp. A9E412]|uniref:DUF1007 family protein n=1 Tax=Aquibium sp. A9E412 TaxID=2976767 RepID=UPI0025AF33A3|nr:DUF1007 family protein [Aquibium sp. A9E412]MDN2567271.1 DUF1007 family protein [Aquibium sp. A9E412]
MPASRRNRVAPVAALVAALAAPATALAHPHVFAEARLDVAVAADGTVEALRHLWRFDDLFSSTVLVEFDRNGDLELDTGELELVAEIVHESLAEFDYFQLVTRNGRDVDMQAPDRLIADFADNQLIILFESAPAETLPLSGTIAFGVYDPTFYTAIDFVEDDYMAVENMPSSCARSVVRPDPDEAIAQNQDTLTEAFFNEPGGNDMSRIFATRLEIDCPAAG